MDVRSPKAFTFNGVTADFRAGVLRDGQGFDIALRRQAFSVLKYLAENAGCVVTKEELIEAVWGSVAVTDDSLADLRKAPPAIQLQAKSELIILYDNTIY